MRQRERRDLPGYLSALDEKLLPRTTCPIRATSPDRQCSVENEVCRLTTPTWSRPARGEIDTLAISACTVPNVANVASGRETVRGRGGGLRLAKAVELIRLGDVVRYTEPDMALVTCFKPIEAPVRSGDAVCYAMHWNAPVSRFLKF